MVFLFFRNFRSGRTAFVAGSGLLTLLVLIFLQRSPDETHRSSNLQATSTYQKSSETIAPTSPSSSTLSSERLQTSSKSDPFTKLLVEQSWTSRKLLANNGMRLSTPSGPVKRILIVTTWRSGSAFTGELLSTAPGVFYTYEPFVYLTYRDVPVNNETEAAKYVHELSQMLQCNYDPLLRSYQFSQIFKGPILDKNAGVKLCKKVKTKEYCEDPERISQACQYFPIQVSKLTRLPLRYIVPIMRQPELDVHVILLVRDPRGTVASRRALWWCLEHCADRKRLCDLLRDNYNTALQVAQELPEKFTVLRYEDLAMDPAGMAYRLTKHLGIPLTKSTLKYIESHTNVDRTDTITVRKKGSRVALWKKNLEWKDIEETQNICGDVLNNYGYLPVPAHNLLNETETFVADWHFPTSLK